MVHNGRILEKPADEDEVRRNIAGYAVRTLVLGEVIVGQLAARTKNGIVYVLHSAMLEVKSTLSTFCIFSLK